MKIVKNESPLTMTIELDGLAEIQVIMNALDAYKLKYYQQHHNIDGDWSAKETYNENHYNLVELMSEQVTDSFIS